MPIVVLSLLVQVALVIHILKNRTPPHLDLAGNDFTGRRCSSLFSA